MLGAGGSARAVVWALAGPAREVTIWNRTTSAAPTLARELGVARSLAEGEALDLAPFDLLVNATSVGLASDGCVQARRCRT